MDRDELNERLPEVVGKIVKSVIDDPRIRHLNRVYLPSREKIVHCITLLRQILFPGYFGKQGLNSENVTDRIGELVKELTETLYDQVRHCLRYRQQIAGEDGDSKDCIDCDLQAAELVAAFFDRIPAVRALLSEDVQAAFDGDPAAHTTDETIFCYPGIRPPFAIT